MAETPLIPMIYEAALDPAGWQPFLDALTTRLDGTSSVLHLQRLAGPQSGQVMAAVGVGERDQLRYEQYYASRNIWTLRGRDRLTQGAVLTGEDVCPNSELENSEYYNDYLEPLGFYHALAAIPSADRNTTLIVTTFRTRRRGAFEAEAIRLQESLTPHLQRAAQVHDRLASAQLRQFSLQEALERMPLGVVLLDLRRRPVFANRAAREIAAAKDGFSLTKEGLSAASPAENLQLQRLLQSAGSAMDVLGSGGGGSLRLSRPSGRRSYEVLISPLPAAGSGAEAAGIIGFIADPEEQRLADTTLLRQLHALTGSEARLASLLVEGSSLTEAADRLGVTHNTARWTLKQVLQKTDTHSQGKLIATLLKGLATIRSRG